MLLIEKRKIVSIGKSSEVKKNNLNSEKVADIINVNLSNITSPLPGNRS